MTILESASQNGISLNDVNYTEPTEIGITDDCEHGIGGFHAEGVDWRWEITSRPTRNFLDKSFGTRNVCSQHMDDIQE